MKRAIVLLVALAIILTTLVGCGAAETTKESTTQEATTQAATTVEKDPFETPVKFSYMSVNNVPEPGKNPLWQFITKKFNVEIEQIIVTWDNWAEKVNISFASGDMPDVMMLSSVTGPDFKKYVQSGLIREVPDFGDKFPNLQKLKDEMTPNATIDNFKVDGKLYAWPKRAYANPVDTNDAQVYFYRRDWAEAVGMSAITDKGALSPDEFEALGKAFIEKDPGKNGPGKTVGLYGANWAFPGVAGPGIFTGYYNVYQKVGEDYIWGATLPEALEGIKFAKKLYDEGILYKDFYVAKDGDGRNLFLAGVLGIFNDNAPLANWEGLKNDFEKSNPGISADQAINAFVVTDANGKVVTANAGDYWSMDLYSAKFDDARLERLVYMMDWLAGEEGTNYCMYGIKGTDWDEADGKVVVKWPKDEATGRYKAPEYINEASTALKTLALSGGNEAMLNPNIRESTKQDYMKVVNTKHEIGLQRVDTGELWQSEAPLYRKFGSYYMEVEEEVTKLIVSSKDVDKDWAEFLKKFEPKVKEVHDEFMTYIKK